MLCNLILVLDTRLLAIFNDFKPNGKFLKTNHCFTLTTPFNIKVG